MNILLTKLNKLDFKQKKIQQSRNSGTKYRTCRNTGFRDPVPSEEFAHFDPDTAQHKRFDIGPDLDLSSKVSKIEMSAVCIPDEEFHKLLQCINVKQRECYTHVVTCIQHKNEPLYSFLTGGAGAGKSAVIDAIFQSLHKILYSEEGENPDDIRILLCASTAKTAYNYCFSISQENASEQTEYECR